MFADYARPSFTPGRALVEAVSDLASRIHGDFTFTPGATSVTTALELAFEQREGVCQDFAHITIACLRSMGLAARYVNGYLETDPPPGATKLQGSDVSHAWVAVHAPGLGWIGIDPTNDRVRRRALRDDGLGRDYSDVPPVSGLIFTHGGTASLEVEVDVIPLTS
jgi:transglutaminase-like putative cysteine protease